MSFVNSLMESITAKMDQGSVDPQLKIDARDRLKKVRGDARLIASEDGYENFLLEEVQREYQRYTASRDELESMGFEESRSKPLCSCDNSQCDLKLGRVPVTIKEADSIPRGIRQFEQDHGGRPIVLHDCRQAWSNKVDRVEEKLMTINIHLTHGIPFDREVSEEVEA